MLWCVAVCCSMSWCSIMCCSVVQCVAVRCSVSQCVATDCSVLQLYWRAQYDELQSVAECCRVLQCAAAWCSVVKQHWSLQYILQLCAYTRLHECLKTNKETQCTSPLSCLAFSRSFGPHPLSFLSSHARRPTKCYATISKDEKHTWV